MEILICGGVLLGSYIVSMLLGVIIIPWLKKLKFGQTVRPEGPQTHLQKSGTPTIGGLIFLIPVVVGGLVLSIFYPDMLPVIIATAVFGIVGFVDDWIKVVKKNKDGLKILQKTIVIVLFSIAYAVYVGWFTDVGTAIDIPFIGTVDSGIFFIIFTIVYLFGTTNTVNFADGLDGLLGGLNVIIMLFVLFVSFVCMPAGSGEDLGMFALLMIGATCAFLFYNLHPAKVFMGDTGSLAIGGAIAALLLQMKMPFMIFIVGLIFVIEGLSVALQVFSFRVFGKRIFKMAPIHHHFELLGWKETKVVTVFWSFCLICCVAAGVICYMM